MSKAWALPAIVLWCVVVASPVVYEVIALLDGRLATPPLTHVVIRYVPWWVAMPILIGVRIWLPIHFGLRYFNPQYIEKLKLFGG